MLQRLIASQSKIPGLFVGTSLFPDFPKCLKENGRDISLFNNSIYYAMLRAAEHILLSNGDSALAAQAHDLFCQMEQTFFRSFFNREKGYFANSIDADTLVQRDCINYCGYFWDSDYHEELLGLFSDKCIDSVLKNAMSLMSFRAFPLWDDSFDADANQFHCTWGAVEEVLLRLGKNTEHREPTNLWIKKLRYWMSKLTCPEGESFAYETETPELDRWNSESGTWQAYTARKWYSELFGVMVVCIATEGGENVAKKQTSGNLALEQQRVIVIPAHDELVARKLRVAAYARVSSSSEDQLNSYRVQNQYYSELISNNPDWEMVDIYADEGITGTSVEKREDFQRMMQDCRKGKIDRILVKSISRFARNTKDCLAAVRELKELGVSVQFEEQGIDTSKVSSEMVTAIMASLAQKGSESISGNVRWGVQKRMEDGTYVASSAPYGYRLVNLRLEIQPEEAEIVRWIFQQYLAGASVNEITKELNTRSAGNNHKWYKAAVTYILSNERYIGDCLWQKCYMTSTVPARQVINRGEKTQYYVEGKHPAIIDKNTFYAAQRLRKQRRTTNGSATGAAYSILTGRILCGKCGAAFRRKNWRGISRWSCRTHSENINLCSILPMEEQSIHAAFCRLYCKLKHHGEPIFTQMLSNLQKIRYSRMLWSEDVISLNKKISDVLSQVQFLAQLQQAGGVDPDTFISSNNKLNEQLRRLKQEKARLLDTDSDDLADRTRDLMDALEDGPDFLDGFDAELFDALVEKIIVDSNECLRFRLKNGLELTEQIERTKR